MGGSAEALASPKRFCGFASLAQNDGEGNTGKIIEGRGALGNARERF